MADVKNVVTLGIGASPGKLLWFITGGLGAGEDITYTVTLEPFDLAPHAAVIALESPALSELFSYREIITLTDHSGNILTNNSGNRLVAGIIRTVRTNVIDLGA